MDCLNLDTLSFIVKTIFKDNRNKSEKSINFLCYRKQKIEVLFK